MTKKQDKELEQQQLDEAARIEKERREGAAALDQERRATKTDKERAAQEEQARAQQEAALKEEVKRTSAEQKNAEKVLAGVRDEMRAKSEAERVEAEKKAADEELERQTRQRLTPLHFTALPEDARLLKAGTILNLNGEPVTLAADAAVVIAGGADEQRFASILAREGPNANTANANPSNFTALGARLRANPSNFALNADRLRLVYNPMNGTPLPLDSQRLKPEEMTEQERAVFGL